MDEEIKDSDKANAVPEQKAGESDADYLKRLDSAASESLEEEPKAVEAKKADEPNEKDIENADKDKPVEKAPEQDPEPVKEELTPIPDDIRKKANIPEKFKYLEDLIKWGTEAEKRMYAAARESAENKKAAEIYQQELAKLQDRLEKKVEKGTLSEEDKQKAIEDFKLEFEIDPVAAIKKALGQSEQKKTVDEKQSTGEDFSAEQERAFQLADNEFKEITAGLSRDDAKTLVAELMEIAKTQPYNTTIKTLNYIRLGKKQETEKRLADEQIAKDKQKAAASFPAEGTKIDKMKETASDVKRIREANSLAALEALEKEYLSED